MCCLLHVVDVVVRCCLTFFGPWKTFVSCGLLHVVCCVFCDVSCPAFENSCCSLFVGSRLLCVVS